ncbi:hypothetical protein EYF80_019260 [Liparis tanakae]|uniref:Uncharacterized protein n=1 Tax=Liparis tanakae TaxID=230148 RepID=A0A4Z2HYW4_9TELE|nr:hypothetical protein EYF80_019260 [Liparis tanakae]
MQREHQGTELQRAEADLKFDCLGSPSCSEPALACSRALLTTSSFSSVYDEHVEYTTAKTLETIQKHMCIVSTVYKDSNCSMNKTQSNTEREALSSTRQTHIRGGGTHRLQMEPMRAGGSTLTLQGVIDILPLLRYQSFQFAPGYGALG